MERKDTCSFSFPGSREGNTELLETVQRANSLLSCLLA